MKNNILFVILVGSMFLISCGTLHHTSYNSQNFVNGIYYTPDPQESNRINEARGKFNELAEETNSVLNPTQSSGSDYNNGTVTTNTGELQEYLAIADKYSTPEYSVNIEFSNPYIGGWYPSTSYESLWGTGPSLHIGTYYSWYNPWYYRYSWYGPGWYDPWYYGSTWYSPWYSPWYSSWYGGWYDPWYGPGYYPGYHPGYYPGHYPGFYPGGHPGFYPNTPPHHAPDRNIYYGKRENGGSTISGNRNGGSYNTRRDGNVNQIRGNNTSDNMTSSATQQNSNRQGSSFRRGANSTTNNGTQKPDVNTSNGKTSSSSGTMYRRSAQPKTKSSDANTNRENRNSNSYNNNNSNYGRSNNPSYNRSNNSSTFNPGNSSGHQRSSGSSSGSGRSGSSYRR
ncbi:MAG: hypothetical protein IKY70_04745 [Bacteroidales bacterium]|nr:hypothetical protein [Bacteroidales bacterium]